MEEINSVTMGRDTQKERLKTAEKLASRNTNPEPWSECFARRTLESYQRGNKQKYDFFSICIETAIELENDREGLEKTAEKLTPQKSNPKPLSEYFAKLTLEYYHEDDQECYDQYLIYIGSHLKLEKKT